MSDTLKYVIVDDDEIDRLAIENEAEKFPFLHRVASCPHPLEAVELIHSCQPDILFVDIEMPDISGLELVALCRNPDMISIFITSHPEFALDSYSIEAFDYIVKPVSADRFARCANRVHEFFRLRNKAFAFDKAQETGYIVVKQGHEKFRIRLAEIQYLEAMKDYTRIFTKEKPYLVLCPLSVMQEKLPAEKFIRIHRSFIVNTDFVSEVKGSRVTVESREIPVGKLYKNALKHFE